jgi:hypothetical protein
MTKSEAQPKQLHFGLLANDLGHGLGGMSNNKSFEVPHDGNVVFMMLLHFHSSCLLSQSLIVRNVFTNTEYSLHPPTSLLSIGFKPSIPPTVDQKAFLCNMLEHTQISFMEKTAKVSKRRARLSMQAVITQSRFTS